MIRSPVLFAVLLVACAHSDTYQDLRTEPGPGAVLIAHHETGFQVVPGLLTRLIHGDRRPEAAWTLRIWKDGRVERDEMVRCTWETRRLPQLTPADLEALLDTVRSLGDGARLLGPVAVEDVSTDSLVFDYQGKRITVTRARDPEDSSEGYAAFAVIWNQIAERYQPPHVRSGRCH